MDAAYVLSFIILWIIVLFNLLLTLALMRKVNGSSQNGSSSQLQSGLKKGEAAPDFTAVTLQDQTVSLATYKGQHTAFLIISATCPPCLEALPKYEELYPLAKRAGTELVLVSTSDAKATQDLANEYKLNIPTIVAPLTTNALNNDFKIQGTPSYCLIDVDGVVQSSGYPDFERGEWKDLVGAWKSGQSGGRHATNLMPIEGR